MGTKPVRENGNAQAFARLLTSNPQFAKAAVNLFWSEFMGRGIVDPPFGFDMDRQDRSHPPPAPWTIQPTHPELLNALAEDFAKHNYDLRYLFKLITNRTPTSCPGTSARSGTRSTTTTSPAISYADSAPKQFWDAVQQSTGVFHEYNIKYTALKGKYILQAHYLDFGKRAACRIYWYVSARPTGKTTFPRTAQPATGGASPEQNLVLSSG